MASLEAEMLGEGNASACITAGACLPLGGHSVWAALPPVPSSGPPDKRPVTVVCAGVDSTAFFHARAKVARPFLINETALQIRSGQHMM